MERRLRATPRARRLGCVRCEYFMLEFMIWVVFI
jgi:hypothetical protein